ncbi:hypothetical protein KJS94_17690 [Flavihumibacter rivuli]|uniref:hypothetical protein n=1 Tax=Flavihumibacter rivuli TaxID=2838156 RepID=UPI001BDE6A0C|nr:hypothetical protein [Flavihumibacter rivuli]ULQ56486.1 hypothetical protein KJS94_17690 [Flavihumibacter rivuli]
MDRYFKRIMVKYLAVVLCWLALELVPGIVWSQDYHAIQGSNHSGALGVHHNPASMVNTPYPWDFTLFGVQAKYATNAVTIVDYSLLSNPMNSAFVINSGTYPRKGKEQVNLNLLNARVALGQRRAIGFGMNIRAITDIRSSSYNYADTIGSADEFLSINLGTEPFSIKARSMALLELYASYGQTIFENTNIRLNAGITVKINRGLSGARVDLNDVQHGFEVIDGRPVNVVRGGSLIYGYSSNYDRWQDGASTNANLRNFMTATRTGFSVDGGLELLIKDGGEPGALVDEEAYYDYTWKFGLSLLDAGWGQYRYGVESRSVLVPANGITGPALDAKFDSTVNSLPTFNDSLATFASVRGLGGNYKIFSPARIVFNADHYLFDAFYINGELSIPVSGLLGENRLYMKDMNLIRITPRWETRRLGFYLPLQYNSANKIWVGAAVKLGPLLMGFHNLGNIFSKNKMASGGGYLALTIRPVSITGSRKSSGLACPIL